MTSKSGLPEDLVHALGTLIGESNTMSVDHAEFRTVDGGVDAVLDVTYIDDTNSKNRKSITRRKTIVYFYRPESQLPEFTIDPRSGLSGKLLGGLVKAMGAQTLEYPDREELMKRYSIYTFNHDSMRVLLEGEPIDALEASTELNIKADRHGIAAWRDARFRGPRGNDATLDKSDRMELLREASKVILPIVNDPERRQRAVDAVEGSYLQEATQNMEASGGMLANAFLGTVITREMSDEFMRQEIPRDVPPALAKRAWRGANFLMAFGFLALLFGIIVSIIVFASELNTPDGEPSAVAYVFMGVALVGLCIFVPSLLWRRNRKRIMQRGRAADAQIESVERTSTSVNNDVIHKITIAPRSGEHLSIVVKVGTEPARVAQQMCDAGTSTRLLLDPHGAKRAIWIDGWVLENIKD